ncbi:hypothetical protein [Rubrivirga sp. SAORIC476]|uniref:hypothetical protein n=1 Tax=Rubrivirga sp. SAORIC476 TaxID=1961794 RepID=UPI00117B6246|nr:hypothetical protein [Rubrivirga sp. SAORIC476]
MMFYIALSVTMWIVWFQLRSGYEHYLEGAKQAQEKDVEFWLAAIGQGSSLMVIMKPGLREAIILIVLLLQAGRWWAVLSDPKAVAKRLAARNAERNRVLATAPDERFPQLVAWMPGDILEGDFGMRYQFCSVTRDHKVLVREWEDYYSLLSEDQLREPERSVDLGEVMTSWKNTSLLEREPERNHDSLYWENLKVKQEAYRQVRKDSGEL